MTRRVDLRGELSVGRHALSVGRVPQTAEWISGVPRRVPGLIELMWDDDPGVANRAADVLERITRRPSTALKCAVADHKEALLGLLAEAEEKKLRWNLAFSVPRITLTIPECRRAAAALYAYLDDPSSIVKTAALHGLADLTRQNPESLPEVIDLLRVAGRSGTPAMRARSRILLKRLENPQRKRRAQTSLHMFD
jgi:HEAT repeat protein